MTQSLGLERLEQLIQIRDVAEVTQTRLFEAFADEQGIAAFAPDGICRRDPRDNSLVIYNSARARRPHDNRPAPGAAAPIGKKETPCPICQGNTTGVLDMAPLSEGYTFINKNLFPCFYLADGYVSDGAAITPDSEEGSLLPHGLHFLQWTSTVHDRDWHNMPPGDLAIVLERLGRLEQTLLLKDDITMPDTSSWHGGVTTRGFVSIIKNLGAAVGGSLAHGHQQIAYSNTMPPATYANWRFEQRHGESFASYLVRTNDPELRVEEYSDAMLLVPKFMKRPFAMMLVPKQTDVRFLHQLTEAQRLSMSTGWSRAAAALHRIMPRVGREVAYNALVHSGPGGGLYVEFLPFTQETGGFEQMGLWVCQDTPSNAAARLRQVISESV